MIAQSYEEFPPGLPNIHNRSVSTTNVIDPEDDRPRIFLVGAARSGKSSIEKVVFQKMSPHETLFLEATRSIDVIDINHNPLLSLQILDFPGGYAFKKDSTRMLSSCSSLILIIDATDSIDDRDDIKYSVSCIDLAYRANPNINIEILIHKVDGDAFPLEEHQLEAQRDIRSKITMELHESNIQNVHLSFHLTSIYDHTIFEAFSKIYQKMLPQFAVLENLLDSLITNSSIEKAFLFDVKSKIYVCTDSNPVDMQTYQLCSDMIDVVVDVSCIYGINSGPDFDHTAADCAFDNESAATIRLSNGHVLLLREMGKYLALVCLMREKSFDKAALVEYNINCLKIAIYNLCDGLDRS
uniref:GTP-binding protein n=1 Tax=Spongospora subterranea TaxID=70186 RepID=A0A0H5R7M3_9EUKA|eukprot:CRZ10165.1 hypothetical protein [Spongospora subterranea]